MLGVAVELRLGVWVGVFVYAIMVKPMRSYSALSAGVALAILAMLVGWSRVYVGIHAPIDIAGAITIAVLAVICTLLVLNRMFPPSTSHKDSAQSDPVTGN